ncbi:MAG: PAS domain S-box protein [Deltaproteobacteria bacterium]|nr:PAS domain S-box protein [Deltaproteobacteria bacterium]
MRLRLSHRFNLYIGGILIAGISMLIYHEVSSNRRLLREIGAAEAEQLSRAIFDQLYTSMRLGGGRDENRAIIERFQKMNAVEAIRTIHGSPLDRQYGIEDDELARDGHERDALEGNKVTLSEKAPGGYSSARFVMPIPFSAECGGCHNAEIGQVLGAISVKVSLKPYEEIISGHTKGFFFWGLSILLLTSLAVLYTVRKRFLLPVERIKDGVEAISRGDLGHRVNIRTNDELEELGTAFDNMAGSLYTANTKLDGLYKKHSRLVEMAVDAILLKDVETGRYVDANPAALVFTGYTEEELRNISAMELYPPHMAGAYQEVFKRWVHDGKGYLHDAVVIRKDGSSAPVEIAASLLESDGKMYLQEIWRDISERKGFEESRKRYITELEDTIRDRTLELTMSVNELTAAYGRLKDSEQKLIESAKLVSLGEMGAGIAHELNSPLAGMLSITEVLMRRLKKDDPNYFLLEKAKDAAVRSKYIIQDMLTYARPFKGDLKPVFVNEAVRATLALFTSEINTSSMEITVDLDPDLPKVMGSTGQLMEVMLNIVKNARDAMQGAGKIFITTRCAERAGKRFDVVEVRDSGPGLQDAVKDRIFDPFFTTKEKGGGHNIGLGLSIARSIVEGHGGTIEGGNAPGGGAVFRITLPVAEGVNPPQVPA